MFPFDRKFKYTVALLFHRRGAGYVKEVGGEEGGGLVKTAAEKERESRCVRVARGRPRKEKGTRDGYINRTVRTCPVEFKEFTPASNNVPDPCVWSRVTDEPSR